MAETPDTPLCELCGEPMPQGEEMFKYHGYSGPCPKPIVSDTPRTPEGDRVSEARSLLWEEAEARSPNDPDRAYDIIVHEEIHRAGMRTPEGDEGVSDFTQVMQALAFAACTIKSGEPWTETCAEVFTGAYAAMDRFRSRPSQEEALRQALTACEEVLRLIHEAAGPVAKGAPMPSHSTFEAWMLARRALQGDSEP